MLVNSCVGFQHLAKVAKFQSALPAQLTQAESESGIIQDSSQFSRKFRCISGTKRKAPIAENLDECAKVGSDHRKGSQHIFCNDQPENFSAQGWHYNDGSLRESRAELCPREAACESNAARQRNYLRHSLESRPLGTITYNQQFKLSIFLSEDVRSFEQNPNALGRYQASLECDHGRL